MKVIIPSLLLSVLAASCSSLPSAQLTDKAVAQTAPKNIIMIVGDGMGPAYTTAYRYFNDDPSTAAVEQTVFDRHLVGLSSTYPAPVSGYVTDSAASATALSSGVKTYNGAIGLDADKKPVETVLEWAKKQGKKTGVVVTSQINHATPASYLAHNESRQNYNAIADSYIDAGIKADVYFGGGWKYFLRDDRNLVNEFKEAGFHYLDNYQALNKIPANKPVLGLFGDSGLPWALDDSNKHRLSAMTKAATKQLENDNGYFMLIEASQIDWGGHGNDITSAMAEMDDLAKTLEYLESYVKKHPDTLVVLTADHSTGGFTVAANGKYQWQPEVLRTAKNSPDHIAKRFEKESISLMLAKSLLHFDISEEEFAQLKSTKAITLAALKTFNQLSATEKKGKRAPNIKRVISKEIKKIIDQRTNTGWTSGGHTAIDVPVFAFGSNKAVFNGFQDNTDIADKIFTLLGKK